MNSDKLKMEVIFSKLLEKYNYKCNVCGLHHGSKGYQDSKSNFVECDNFMLKWAEANEKKVFKVTLSAFDISGQGNSSQLHNYMLVCHLCKSKLHKQLISLHSKNIMENLKYDKTQKINSNNIIDIAMIVMLKQLFYSLKGVEITNTEAQQLINVINK